MSPDTLSTLTSQANLAAQTLAGAVRDRIRPDDDAGLSTLEMAILALGLLAIAGILIAALTSAVNNRVSKIQ